LRYKKDRTKLSGWSCTLENCWDNKYICSKCYSDWIVRRKLDAKTAQHHYFRKFGVRGKDFPNAPTVLKEGEWYETCDIKDTGTGDSESGTYMCVGFWKDDKRYKQQIIQRPFIFTKHV
jgi:hypothetical protein